MDVKVFSKKKTCLIFDLDGVIVDTMNIHYLSWKPIFNKFDCNLTKNNYLNKFKGVPKKGIITYLQNKIERKLSDKEISEIFIEKDTTYKYLIEQANFVDVNIVKNIIMRFKEHFCVCLISASQNARFILNKIGIEDLFSLIIDGDFFNNEKSKKTLFSHFIKTNNFYNYVIFEDSIEILWAAKEIGFVTIGISTIKTPWLDYQYSDFKDIEVKTLIQNLKL